jgi:DNA-binding NarL/FixJ family response regulator
MKAAKGAAEPSTPKDSGKRPKASGRRIRAAAPRSARPHILLVEDEEGVAKALKKTLEKWADLTWTRNYDEAVAAFLNRVSSALITDMRLDGPSGFLVLERFRELKPRTPAMVLTAYFDEADSIRACELGAQYVAKPITTLGLQRFVEEAKPEPLPVAPAYAGLSLTEQKVYGLLAKRFSNREVADRLEISVETVKSHIKHIFKKLRVSSRTALAR